MVESLAFWRFIRLHYSLLRFCLICVIEPLSVGLYVDASQVLPLVIFLFIQFVGFKIILNIDTFLND